MCTLIFAFWGGVLKDRQALFSLQVLWNLILVAMLCKLETRPQLWRFVSINAIAFKSFLVRMIKNQFYSSS